MDKKVTISEKQATLKERVLTMMEKKNLKPAEISRITGRSEGTISDFLNDKKSFTDKLLNVIHDRLKDYMGDDELVQTRQFMKMMNIAKAGKKMSDMRLVVGNTGVGKSVVFKKFAEENECCYYVKIDRKEMTWNNFLMKVSKEMGIDLDRKRKRFSTSYLLDRIIEKVEEKADSDPQLIIDEAEIAKNSLFKDFKTLQTATEGLLNIVVVGITDVVNRIGRLAGLEYKAFENRDNEGNITGYYWKWHPVKENSNIYTTFARRISVFRIDNISREDIASFCTEKGIRDKKVVDLACARWWNYEDADRVVKRAERMGINLENITPVEFEVL